MIVDMAMTILMTRSRLKNFLSLLMAFIIYYFRNMTQDVGVQEDQNSQTWYNDSMALSRRKRVLRLYLRQKLATKIIIALIGLFLIGTLFLFVIFVWYARDLPAPGKLSQINDSATVFYDRNDKVLFELYKDKNRLPATSDEISDYLKKATVAIEDKNFYQHQGISETGIIRAMFSILTGHGVQGGSTITQQLIKNVLLNSRL